MVVVYRYGTGNSKPGKRSEECYEEEGSAAQLPHILVQERGKCRCFLEFRPAFDGV